MLTELGIQVAPDNTDDQGNQGGHEGGEGNGSHTGGAHGDHGEEGAVVQGEDGDGAGVGVVAVLLGDGQVLTAGGVGQGGDNGHGGHTQEPGRAEDGTDGKTQGNAQNELDQGQDKTFIERHADVAHIDGCTVQQKEQAQQTGGAGAEQAGGKAADFQSVGGNGVDDHADEQRDNNDTAWDFSHECENAGFLTVFHGSFSSQISDHKVCTRDLSGRFFFGYWIQSLTLFYPILFECQ